MDESIEKELPNLAFICESIIDVNYNEREQSHLRYQDEVQNKENVNTEERNRVF